MHMCNYQLESATDFMPQLQRPRESKQCLYVAHQELKLTLLKSCKCCFLQDLINCFLAYRRVLLRFSMSSFTQLAHQIAPSFYFTSILRDAASGGNMYSRTAGKKKERKTALHPFQMSGGVCKSLQQWQCSSTGTGGTCSILPVLLMFESSSSGRLGCAT